MAPPLGELSPPAAATEGAAIESSFVSRPFRLPLRAATSPSGGGKGATIEGLSSAAPSAPAGHLPRRGRQGTSSQIVNFSLVDGGANIAYNTKDTIGAYARFHTSYPPLYQQMENLSL